MVSPSLRCTAFSGNYRIASGELRHVALKAKQAFDAHPERPVLVFDDADARTLELPLELPPADLLAWLSRPQRLGEATAEPERPRRPGRPKLGVVPREVTLLPRHWDWLARQPGGASVALRKLVQSAMRDGGSAEAQRRATEAAYRFMSIVCGDLPQYEEVSRALFAGDLARVEALAADWPTDLTAHLRTLLSQIDAAGVRN